MEGPAGVAEVGLGEDGPLGSAQRLERRALRLAGSLEGRRTEACELLVQAAALYDVLLADLAADAQPPDQLLLRSLRLQRDSALRTLHDLRRPRPSPMASARQRSSDSATEKLRAGIFEQLDEQEALLAQLEPMSAQKVLKNQETVTAIRQANRELKKLFKALLADSEAKDRLIEDLLLRLDAAEHTPKASPKPSPKPSPIPTFQPSTATSLAEPIAFEPLQLPQPSHPS